jgi:ribosomal-protein-serine acetyltransferase
VDYAFSGLKLNRVEIACATENKKSQAIPKRLGFTEEGIARQAEWLYDHYVDHIVYGLLASDWKCLCDGISTRGAKQ